MANAMVTAMDMVRPKVKEKTSKFEIKYENNQIGIKLNIVNNEKHFLYYIVPLLQKIADDLSV